MCSEILDKTHRKISVQGPFLGCNSATLLKKILMNKLYVSEAVIEKYCEIYYLEIKTKPTTRDKNCFIIDVGRGLHPSLLATSYHKKIGVLHVSVSI